MNSIAETFVCVIFGFIFGFLIAWLVTDQVWKEDAFKHHVIHYEFNSTGGSKVVWNSDVKK